MPIKKLFRYLLPVLAIPFLGILDSLWIARLSYVNAMAVAARTMASACSTLLSWPLQILAIACLAVTAICAESGKARRAKGFHLGMMLGFAGLLCITVTVGLFAPRWVAAQFISMPEISAATAVYLRVFAAALGAVSLVGFLLGQIVFKRYSMTRTLIVCGALWSVGYALAWLLTGLPGLGVAALALADGLLFATYRVLPFAFVPWRLYYQDFLQPDLGASV